MAPTAALSVTSQTCVAMPGALSTVSFSASALRSTAKTRAPSSTKRAVVARPLPQPGPTQPAPVTIAILSLSCEPIAAARIPVEGGRGLDHDGREQFYGENSAREAKARVDRHAGTGAPRA